MNVLIPGQAPLASTVRFACNTCGCLFDGSTQVQGEAELVIATGASSGQWNMMCPMTGCETICTKPEPNVRLDYTY